MRRRGVLAAIASAAAVAAVLLPAGSAHAQVAPFSQTFTFTGGEQLFTVPEGVTRLHVVAIGGSGGSVGTASSTRGGYGSRIEGDIVVTPGQLLFVEVGGTGTRRVGGWNGGAFAQGSLVAVRAPGGGGGASDVRTVSCGASCPGNATSLGSRLVVAGGGGGAGGPGTAVVLAGTGGRGGTADTDGLASGTMPGDAAGRRGTLTSGGAGGESTSSFLSLRGRAGAFGVGGVGGSALLGGGGGGGGGGVYGGGGGAGGGTVVLKSRPGTPPNTLSRGGGGGGGGASLIPAGGVRTAPATLIPASVTLSVSPTP